MRSRQTHTLLGIAPRIFVRVTQEIIDEAVSRNSNHCMVAEAIREKYPELRYIAVDIQTIRASDKEKGERYVWLTPRSVQTSIIAFDQGKRLKPFGFQCRQGQVIESGRMNGKSRTPAKLRKMKGTRRIPERVGGITPPRSIGQRRAYGLRRLQF